MGKRPLDVLHLALNKKVLVELRSGVQYRGILDGYDHPHLNVVVSQAEEVAAGTLVRKSDKVLLRGDAILYIAP